MSSLSILPYESVETGELPPDLMASYVVAVTIAGVADSAAGCASLPELNDWALVSSLERLEIPGDVFTLLTTPSAELNCVREHPVAYWHVVEPNAHLVCYKVWDRLLAQCWFVAQDLGLAPGTCCADRFEFDRFTPSVLRGHERPVREHFANLEVPRSQSLVAELQLEVSRAAQRRSSAKPFIQEERAKGKPGRRGYPIKALDYARKLREAHPTLKAHTLRQRCLEKFSEDDLPPDDDTFRRWLNRKRASRAD